MDIKFVGRCTQIFKSDRGTTYYDFDDLEKGGVIKLSIDGEIPGLKDGGAVKFSGVVRGRLGKSGGINLVYVDGSFVPAEINII